MCLPNGRTRGFAPTKTPITLLDPKHNFDAFALPELSTSLDHSAGKGLNWTALNSTGEAILMLRRLLAALVLSLLLVAAAQHISAGLRAAQHRARSGTPD